VDVAAHYRQLVQLGREEFLAATAPAALVRYRTEEAPEFSGLTTLTLDETVDESTLPIGKEFPEGQVVVEIYPLAKKPGASFADRITIGRTPNNDIAINDHSVSRLHAYVRQDGGRWIVADAGSKNGSWLRGRALEPRKEQPLPTHAILRIGEVDLTFYVAADLFTALEALA
jgi:pSer/pThr/pTyr-binding forkhead associated (FHA) protein